jgi:hypothetical protein
MPRLNVGRLMTPVSRMWRVQSVCRCGQLMAEQRRDPRWSVRADRKDSPSIMFDGHGHVRPR